MLHKILEENQKNIKLTIQGKETIGKVIGVNSARAIFETEETKVILNKAQKEKAFEEMGK